MSKKAKKAAPAHSKYAVEKAERFALGTFLSDCPDDISFDEVLALLKDDDRDEDIDLSIAQAFEDYPTDYVVEQIIVCRDSILSWFGAEMDVVDHVANATIPRLKESIEDIAGKAQRLCIHKPWTEIETEAIQEVLCFSDNSVWFEDIVSRLVAGDKDLFDRRQDTNLKTGAQVAAALRQAVEARIAQTPGVSP